MAASLLDPPSPSTRSLPSAAERLRLHSVAVRVSLRWLGVRKTLTPEQKTQAAESFGAAGDYLSARKKLLDTRHPAFQEVTGIRGRIQSYWRGTTLPYPEPGIRLLRQNGIEPFHQEMQDFQTELEGAVERLEEHYSELKASAQRRLGQLYSPRDYPPSLQGWFGVEWDFPSVEPPDYLLQLHPDIYEQEKNRVTQRFQQAVELAEQAFVGEFSQLVSHLTERLAPGPDGQRKVFRDSVITNLLDFFNKFRQLNVDSNQELDELIERSQRLVAGVEAQDLRENDQLRKNIGRQLAQVQFAMDQMLVDQPRRRIIRNQPSSNGEPHGPDH